MDLRDMRHSGIDNVLHSTLLDFADDVEKPTQNNPSKAYIRDAKAMASTQADDVKEYPNSYIFTVDMPGIAAADIKVQLDDDNVLVVSGERKREKEEGVKYLRMERRQGKFMRKFPLPENANVDAISVVCRDGALVVSLVTVQQLPPPEPKRPIEVKVGG